MQKKTPNPTDNLWKTPVNKGKEFGIHFNFPNLTVSTLGTQ